MFASAKSTVAAKSIDVDETEYFRILHVYSIKRSVFCLACRRCVEWHHYGGIVTPRVLECKYFFGRIYKNTGQRITCKGGDRGR